MGAPLGLWSLSWASVPSYGTFEIDSCEFGFDVPVVFNRLRSQFLVLKLSAYFPTNDCINYLSYAFFTRSAYAGNGRLMPDSPKRAQPPDLLPLLSLEPLLLVGVQVMLPHVSDGG